jgi:acyl-CoA thioesterase-1
MRELILTLACALLATAQDKAPEFAPIADDPSLPRVLLVGDSISIGYTLPVRTLLAGKANVHRIRENGGPTSNGIEKIGKWLEAGRWDVIHFNFGLHDLKRMENGAVQVSLEDYERNLRTIVERMKATGAVLIFASTTPVPEGKVSPPRVPADVLKYNAVAVKVMKDSGVAVNDLYTLAFERLKEIQRPVNVHFTEAGSEVLAGQVTLMIEQVLPRKSDRYLDGRK